MRTAGWERLNDGLLCFVVVGEAELVDRRKLDCESPSGMTRSFASVVAELVLLDVGRHCFDGRHLICDQT